MRRALPFFLSLGAMIAEGCTDASVDLGARPVVLQNEAMKVTVSRSPFALRVENAAGRVLFESIRGGDAYSALATTHRAIAFKTHLIEGWDYQDPTDGAFADLSRVRTATSDGVTATLTIVDRSEATRATMTLALANSELRIDVTNIAGPSAPNASDDQAPAGLNLASLAFALPADEHFFGLGERLVTVDHRGTTYGAWVEEGGIGAGEAAAHGPTNPSPNGPTMTHAPIPFFLSTRGYGVWQDTSFRTGTSFGGERPDAWRIWAGEPALHLRVFVRDDPRDTIADFTARTGRAHLPAPWVFGTRMRLDSGKTIGGVPEIELLRQKRVPVSAADDATHFLPIGSQVGREAELAAWTARLHELGYKAIAYYNAYVSVTDPRAKADADFARQNDFFVKMDDGTEADVFMISAGPQTVATIDMTNPRAVAWYQSLLDRALGLGYDGWMLDFGEYLPPKAKLYDGRSGWEAHNAFPVLYQKATMDHMRAVRGDDFLFFSRAGYTGTQATTVVQWSGDPAASFDDVKGLPAQVRSGVNSGLSGVPYWGSDVSGYACLNDPPADKEVYLRWAEFGALSPEMHEENACSGAMPQKKWNLWDDDETVQVFGDYARLHTRLFPYLYAMAKVAADTGLPIMRHPILEWPADPNAWAVDLEYGFGDALYVAPVVRRGMTRRSLWLPPGEWVDWWTLEPALGGKPVLRDAPLALLPMWMRAGTIVPLLDSSIDTLSPATSPSVVTYDKVKGILDARVVVSSNARRATRALVDGRTFDASLATGPLALPASFTQATQESDLATCASCGRIDDLPGGAKRVRISTGEEQSGVLDAGALRLAHAGSIATRARWDVVVLP